MSFVFVDWGSTKGKRLKTTGLGVFDSKRVNKTVDFPEIKKIPGIA